ncbi:galanin peptides isoform X1 [Antechinus flavipes]|uniref:galanin peptides isoform X1 n=1 Tax=Antechinus flavipes TaxID=38775 RepID=UPI002235AD8A|nr:galanin peptides isoform X1 [Antechinus flavipes]
MQRCSRSLLLASLILCVTLSETLGLVLSAKEKRGWTLNSAGYLLGPRIQYDPTGPARGRGSQLFPSLLDSIDAVDNHRSFNDKHGLAGKREVQDEDGMKPGNSELSMADENIVRTILEFLTYLHLRDAGALDKISVSSEETNES